MKDVVVLAGTAIGSVLSLLEEIKRNHKPRAFVLTLNTDSSIEYIFDRSIFVDFSHNLKYTDNLSFFTAFKKWYDLQSFNSKPILYFTTDTSCYLVSLYRDWFDIHFELCLPSNKIIEIYTRKGVAEFDAEKNGLQIPRTAKIDSIDDMENVYEEFSFPVILKPKSTYEGKKSLFKVRVIEKDHFKEFLISLLNDRYVFVCQEFIPGGDREAFFYLFYRSKGGKINDIVGRKVLQNPPRAGIMAKGVVESHPDLIEQCRTFLKQINYTGIGGIEFKKHNDKFYFIEMSTRLEGFFKISAFSTYPIAIDSYNDFNDINTDSSTIINTIGALYFDVVGTINAHIRNKDIRGIFMDLYLIFFGKKKVINIFSLNDIKPFFRTLKHLIKRWND